MEIHGWNLVHSTVINLHSEGKHDHIFNVIEDFLRKEFDIEESLLNELMILQRNFLIDYNQAATYPRIIKFNHDILGYVQDTNDLNDTAEYFFEFPEDKNMSLARFCEQIFFARRRNFGKAWVSKNG
jgi:hypothetical protein